MTCSLNGTSLARTESMKMQTKESLFLGERSPGRLATMHALLEILIWEAERSSCHQALCSPDAGSQLGLGHVEAGSHKLGNETLTWAITAASQDLY